jgi:hypothetical protein
MSKTCQLNVIVLCFILHPQRRMTILTMTKRKNRQTRDFCPNKKPLMGSIWRKTVLALIFFIKVISHERLLELVSLFYINLSRP